MRSWGSTETASTYTQVAHSTCSSVVNKRLALDAFVLLQYAINSMPNADEAQK